MTAIELELKKLEARHKAHREMLDEHHEAKHRRRDRHRSRWHRRIRNTIPIQLI